MSPPPLPFFTISELTEIAKILDEPRSKSFEAEVSKFGVTFVSVIQHGTSRPCWESKIPLRIRSENAKLDGTPTSSETTENGVVAVTLAQLRLFLKRIELAGANLRSNPPSFRIHHIESDEMNTEFVFNHTDLTLAPVDGNGWRIENPIKVQIP